MSYEYKSIREVIEEIGKNEVYLPAIQRRFVWEPEQIQSFFDSIMRGYPIGTFLFWFVWGEKKNEYTFYKFLQEYHERDNYLNQIAPKPELKEKIIGVLDGQQRLNSMFIALQGTYAYKKPYARRDSDSAYPRRIFYLNLLKESLQREGQDFIYQFKFLREDEAGQIDVDHLWFPVREVLTWGDDPEIDDYYDNLLDGKRLAEEIQEVIRTRRAHIKKTLRILHQRLVLEELISYYRIEEQDLDSILDIFVRVNSGGTILSKSDLLFSTIVANWEQARQEIETFLQSINKKGNEFQFDNDFIMRSCLVLTDCPILFKVKSFKRSNIERIRSEWEAIKSAIAKAVDLLVEFGFSWQNLTSQNAVIPIAYYVMKGGNLSPSSKSEIRRYLVRALLKQVYGGHGDQVLSSIRETFRSGEKSEGRETALSFSPVFSGKLPGEKTLEITDEDIEEILEYKKGPYTFTVLSLLYPNLKLGQVEFHQDHMHPASLFTDAKLKKHAVQDQKHEKWQDIKDRLPNLQLMEGKENKSKSKTPIQDWIRGTDADGNPNVVDVDKYKRDNYIPDSISLAFSAFEEFYETRRRMLRQEMKRVLR